MIKFVYFDVGGVVIRDFEETDKWNIFKKDIGITESLEQPFMDLWNEYKERIGIDFDVDNLPAIFAQKLGISFPKNYSLLDDFVSRFEKNKSIWPVINVIKETCRIGLLTDMYPRMLPKIIERNLFSPVNWDVIIDSSKVGCRKPHEQIYRIAQGKVGVQNEEILFIDNLTKNLVVPKKLGWKTFLYDPNNFEQSSIDLGKYFDQIRVL